MNSPSFHTDPAHTGYGEIATMINSNFSLGFLSGEQIGEIVLDGAYMRVKGKLPASEISGGIADDFRGATQGRAFFGYEFIGFEPVPKAFSEKFILEIRKRKGMPDHLPDGSSFKRFIYVRT